MAANVESRVLPIRNNIDVNERIKTFLTSKGYAFEEKIHIDTTHIIHDAEIRPLNEQHVQFLANQMRKDPNNINNILYYTPIIAYSIPHHQNAQEFSDPQFFILDGNHRFSAAILFNVTQTENHIFTFMISFHILSNVSLEHKLILISMAEEKAFENKRPLDRFEIMKHTRFLLLKSPYVLELEGPPSATSNATKQIPYGKKVVEAVTKFFHICHPSLVLRNVWKATRISDVHFNAMYPHFQHLPTGFNVHDFDIVFNKYLLSPNQITLLITNYKATNGGINEFRTILRNHVKPELIPTLRQYKSYNNTLSPEQHLKFIVGEEYYTANGFTKIEKIVEEYLIAKKRNLRNSEGFEEKLKYLQRNFEEWFQDYQTVTERTPHTPSIHNITPATLNNPETTPTQTIENFINQLIENKMESYAAFAIHFLIRPLCPEQPLSELYHTYLKNEMFDFTKLLKDDGSAVAETINLDKFGHFTLFKDAITNHIITLEQRKRKTVIQSGTPKKKKTVNPVIEI